MENNQITTFRWAITQWEEIDFTTVRAGDIIMIKHEDEIISLSMATGVPSEQEDNYGLSFPCYNMISFYEEEEEEKEEEEEEISEEKE